MPAMLLSEIHEALPPPPEKVNSAPASAAIPYFATHGCGITLTWGGDNSSKCVDEATLTYPMVRTERVLICAP